MKWKSRLISSSLPLEFEVAKILVSKKFAVRSDFVYGRNSSGTVKDFSVDIHAIGYPPFSDPNKTDAIIELLIECKQRIPQINWLFFPDPNPNDFSPITLGCTLNPVDEFSNLFFLPNATVSFEKGSNYCYKGTEIDIKNGEVRDSELKHGIAQLQYALPRLYSESITINSLGHPEDNRPFLVCAILVTTSKLFVAHKNINIEEIEKASSIEEIADEVSNLILFSDYGPDFEDHVRKECAQLANLERSEKIQNIEAYRRANGEYDFLLPIKLALSFSQADRYPLISHFSQFVICNKKFFPILIDRIKRIGSNAARNLVSQAIHLY